MTRRVYEVSPHPKGWKVSAGRGWAIFCTKHDAVAEARRFAKRWHRSGFLSQLRVRGRDGKIQFENTYGKDPRRTKG